MALPNSSRRDPRDRARLPLDVLGRFSATRAVRWVLLGRCDGGGHRRRLPQRALEPANILFPWQKRACSRVHPQRDSWRYHRRQGRASTLRALLSVRQIVAPTKARLVCVDQDGVTTKKQMQADDSRGFSIALDALEGSFRYHIEAGEASSDDHSVTAIEPVDVAAETAIDVVPPQYALATCPVATHGGLPETVSAWQYSTSTSRFASRAPPCRRASRGRPRPRRARPPPR